MILREADFYLISLDEILDVNRGCYEYYTKHKLTVLTNRIYDVTALQCYGTTILRHDDVTTMLRYNDVTP